MTKIHELKTWPALFEEIRTGAKTFDLRKNDRGFQTGDSLIFREWCPETQKYSGRKLEKRVGFMLTGEWGLKPGNCAMSLLALDSEKEELREKLAKHAHAQWAAWMKYLFSKGRFNEDGSWTMPREFVLRWDRQMKTPYSELSEKEKESDRTEADKFLKVIYSDLD